MKGVWAQLRTSQTTSQVLGLGNIKQGVSTIPLWDLMTD